MPAVRFPMLAPHSGEAWHVAVTPQLLARLTSLDDLLEMAVELGYTPAMEELSAPARRHLGLGDAQAVSRAGILARHGPFRVYGAVLADASRSAVAGACERLARATPGERNLLFALPTDRSTLAIAVAGPSLTGPRARQFRVPIRAPSAIAADIVNGLAPLPDEAALALSARLHDVLAEEGLTSRFFREFARLHLRAADTMRGVPRATDSERRDLALVVLTRLLFLYFVQSKGWLAGRSDFLPSLLDTALRSGRQFHQSVFEPLCFGALSAPVGARRGVARALGGVPFLNGGLFEPHALERRFTGAHLPDDTWRELFDDLFERFHFTVRERDDTDAVDPEMLGRVFEGLMARERRRSSGTYFTPRDLLRDTVSHAIAAALDGLPESAVRGLRILDPAVGSGAFLLEALAQLDARRAALWPHEPPAERRRAIVRDCLFGVDADPMAVRLAELRLWLALVVDEDAPWDQLAPLPNLDQNLRQGDSLLSPLDLPLARVPGAPARLRAVAERRSAYFAATGRDKAALARDIRRDERALACAGADAELATLTARLTDAAAAAGRDLFGRRARRDPTAARRVAEWRRRRRELLATRRRITAEDALPFFSYDLHFGDVAMSGGFDVVAGNPPWVRGERLPLSQRAPRAPRYSSFHAQSAGRRGFAHLPDLSVAFLERALQLVRPGGAVGFILPAKLLRAGYAGGLRALLRERTTVLHLEDRSHAVTSSFAATVFPMVLVLRRGAPDQTATARVRVVGASGAVLEGYARQSDLPLDAVAPRAPWLCLPRDEAESVRKALAAGQPLGQCYHPRLGVKTGANDLFVRDASRANELPLACRVPAVQGRDIAPFAVRPGAVLLAALDARGGPLRTVPREVGDYLAPHASTLSRRADARGVPPWALFRTELLRARWLVLWRDIAGRLESAVLERAAASAPIPLNTCYGVTVPDEHTAHWLAALLNSTPARALACAVAERASGGAYRFDARTVGTLPLPTATGSASVRALAAIGRAAAAGHDWSQHDLDRHAVLALGLPSQAAAALAGLDAALRRAALGDR
jgi:hypothetical protein